MERGEGSCRCWECRVVLEGVWVTRWKKCEVRKRKEKKGGVQVVLGPTSVEGMRHTFSSSLRFSLRFLRRLAISARRMACSSAVRCFFI